jgi:hypothetical protein
VQFVDIGPDCGDYSSIQAVYIGRGEFDMNARIAVGVVTLLLALTAPTWAHHAFSGEFDAEQPVELRGTIARVEFINPHSWFHIDVTENDGTVTRWMIEGGTPNALFRRGVTQNTLPVGTEILVDGFRALDGSNRANGRDMTFADGRRIFLSGGSAVEQPQ